MNEKFASIGQTLRQRSLRFVVVLSWVLVLVCLYLVVSTYFSERNIAKQQDILDSKNEELDRIASMTGFVKFDYVDMLQSKVVWLSWDDRIQKIVDMIQSIKSIGSQEWQNIVLTDFTVTPKELAVRGTVSSLALLYFSRPESNFYSVIDRFKSLPFINDMKVKNYTKRDDGAYEFVLQATVEDGTTEQ
jgi:hypothetical protein